MPADERADEVLEASTLPMLNQFGHDLLLSIVRMKPAQTLSVELKAVIGRNQKNSASFWAVPGHSDCCQCSVRIGLSVLHFCSFDVRRKCDCGNGEGKHVPEGTLLTRLRHRNRRWNGLDCRRDDCWNWKGVFP